MSNPPPKTPSPQAIRVLGGTYRETCLFPPINDLRGSGLRAAAIIASLGGAVALTTCVDARSEAEATALCRNFNITPDIARRSEDVTFQYATPISEPSWAYGADIVSLRVRAAQVVAFGMIDAQWHVEADQVVIDPQHGDLDIMLAGLTAPAESVAVVLNAHEARRLTGLPVDEAGPRLLDRGPGTIVIKEGALGGTVFHGSRVERYGSIPTPSTRTIGSGDAFTAGFAHAFFQNPSEPLSAAHWGAQVAAAHSLTDVPQVTPHLIQTLPRPLRHPTKQTPRVYLAAPFFTTAELLLLETVWHGLLDAGVEVFSPYHRIGLGGDEVAAADLDGLTNCHAVLALLDGADPGTIFECGWATRARIPVVGFAADPAAHDWTMLRGSGALLSNDLTSAVYSAAWAAISTLTAGATGS